MCQHHYDKQDHTEHMIHSSNRKILLIECVQLWIPTTLGGQIAIALSTYTVSELSLLWKLEFIARY